MDDITRGELADRVDASKETIRYYEKRGLIPRPRRSSAGYRLYDESYIERLEFISRAKTLGFTLDEIGELLSLRTDGEVPIASVREKAQRKLDEVAAKIDDLQQIHAALSSLLDACEASDSASECPILDEMQDSQPA